MNSNIDIEILYEQWCKNTANSSESAEIKNAFFAGCNSAFNKMLDLMKMANMLDKSDSYKTNGTPKHLPP